ncbi:bacterioferritin-associated ferredoxin [Parvularcula marina]|uniref:(2Fe-2S)-binding protein n=2 Tax=Parvularcula marina TaxID=2292771 RepID=A0A371RIJ3_9PROT|nr:(2Fe-2S)-binding protein [Parvularcula marina]
MIVCVCRRLNCTAVKEAISSGARSPECVQAHHGHQFNCGRCRTTIGEMIASEMDDRATPETLLAAE